MGKLGDLADLGDDPEVLGSRIADAWKRSPVVELGGPVPVMTAEIRGDTQAEPSAEQPRDLVLDAAITSGLVHTEAAIDTHSTDNAGGAAARDSDSSSVSADVRLDTVSNSSARYFFFEARQCARTCTCACACCACACAQVLGGLTQRVDPLLQAGFRQMGMGPTPMPLSRDSDEVDELDGGEVSTSVAVSPLVRTPSPPCTHRVTCFCKHHAVMSKPLSMVGRYPR